ncbi:MAG: DNA gyrase subunit B [Candidatus Yanofskybacteria bacterium RIFCSPHIGHO2_01_FULL_41_21]|uniref:DNA topoisomerase (ATP-hydrolyzing) n=1 Tax=Candidatus Yanofskybacteria bacterium RIFCSPHIGHO2_01_FULL_41_21 TaxID=1802660 RepID=A0A1F8EBX2_9BACT|nr:MAG: DNA gyrase subunit B [Candidatus Yanofskybacteria bacterium RIFCSPHIGHO2_01_FULL_41_21]
MAESETKKEAHLPAGRQEKQEPARTANIQSGGYTAKDIQVLEGLEPVRKRPGMYIGSTGIDGLHHLIWEVFDNSLDEAMAGHASHIEVALLADNKVRVSDDGRGIPTDIHPKTKKSALETAATTLHAGGKFEQGAYKVSGGLHGVGLSVVNALSTWMKAEVYRKPDVFAQEYKIGKPQGPVKKVGTTKKTGTTITFQPDPTIFPDITFDITSILNHIRQQAYLTKGVKITVTDARAPLMVSDGKGKQVEAPLDYTFYFEGGIMSYVDFLNHGEEAKNKNIFYVGKDQQDMFVEVALQYVEDLTSRELSFANNIHTIEGGTHLTGFRSALTRILNDYARKNGFLKEKEDNLSGEDVREGLTVVISIKLREPQFEGQTKAKLGTTEARNAIETVMNAEFTDWLERNPNDARDILDKVILASKARLAAKAARDTVLRKGALEGMTLPGKLADCSSRDASESELFIVEGDSAGGCFSGDTKVALLDGRNISFKKLVEEDAAGKKNYCYTIKNDGNVGVAQILNPRITKKNAEVIKITLDNKEEIVCTPDHKFMLRDGTYKEVQYLTKNYSLMPLYRRLSKIAGRITIKGYEMVYNPAEHYWRFTHVLADQYNLVQGIYSTEGGDARHHKDFNKLNNNPDNLIRMRKLEHLLFHTQWLEKTARTPEVLEKLRKIRQSPEYRAKISQTMKMPAMRAILSKRAKKQWENKEYKEFMNSKFLEFYNSNDKYRQENSRFLNEAQKTYWASDANRETQAKRVADFFDKNPEYRALFSQQAKQQWSNKELLAWRSLETKKQWTPAFRAKRKEAYNKTYFTHTIKFMKRIFDREHALDQYDILRVQDKSRNLLRSETFCQRFFNGDSVAMIDAVKNYNHKIRKIEKLTERADVYDLEVPGTHNFALASGVFVHNSSKQARNRHTQAILPLRGKILNVEKARLDKMLASQEIRNLIIAMGTAIAEEFDLSKLRYHKIVIMTDADVDGAHIRTLLLTLFYRYFPQVIAGGHLYIAQPPLYKVQKGTNIHYAYNDIEKDKIIEEFRKVAGGKDKVKAKSNKEKTENGEWEVTAVGDDGKESSFAEATEDADAKIAGVSLQRYKGLGEMNPDQLWETTLNPENRVLLQVNVKDAQSADKVFDVLMGSDVMPRKKFIQTHAKSVQNLDI